MLLFAGDWFSDSKIGANELWTNSLEAGNDAPVWRQAQTIVLAANPLYCLDACDASVASEDCGYTDGTGRGAVVNVCEDERRSQFWRFTNGTGEVESVGSHEAGLEKCLGWASGTGAAGTAVTVRLCDGTNAWGASFFMPQPLAAPVHGSFFFSPYRNWNERGRIQPRNVHNLTASKSLYKTISTDPGSKSYKDYTVWNTSVMSVVIAGNSTLHMETNSCPIEGLLKGREREFIASFIHYIH